MSLLFTQLEQQLQRTLATATLRAQTLPNLNNLSLYLLDPDYPRTPMSSEQMQAIWQEPAYWIFCWASGLAMAQWLLANPEYVRGKRVLDFGAGSGVVAIAAKQAGAAEVVACDIDPLALLSCQANAELNGVELSYSADFYQLNTQFDVLLAADVLYDISNRHFLDEFLQRAPQVLVADSRVKNFEHPRYKKLTEQAATTWPDLDEFDEFRVVRFYQSC
jgi:predicted nicotinamide N-methyase